MVMGTPADLLLPQAALFSMPASGKDAEPAVPGASAVTWKPGEGPMPQGTPKWQATRTTWVAEPESEDGQPPKTESSPEDNAATSPCLDNSTVMRTPQMPDLDTPSCSYTAFKQSLSTQGEGTDTSTPSEETQVGEECSVRAKMPSPTELAVHEQRQKLMAMQLERSEYEIFKLRRQLEKTTKDVAGKNSRVHLLQKNLCAARAREVAVAEKLQHAADVEQKLEQAQELRAVLLEQMAALQADIQRHRMDTNAINERNCDRAMSSLAARRSKRIKIFTLLALEGHRARLRELRAHSTVLSAKVARRFVKLSFHAWIQGTDEARFEKHFAVSTEARLNCDAHGPRRSMLSLHQLAVNCGLSLDYQGRLTMLSSTSRAEDAGKGSTSQEKEPAKNCMLPETKFMPVLCSEVTLRRAALEKSPTILAERHACANSDFYVMCKDDQECQGSNKQDAFEISRDFHKFCGHVAVHLQTGRRCAIEQVFPREAAGGGAERVVAITRKGCCFSAAGRLGLCTLAPGETCGSEETTATLSTLHQYLLSLSVRACAPWIVRLERSFVRFALESAGWRRNSTSWLTRPSFPFPA